MFINLQQKFLKTKRHKMDIQYDIPFEVTEKQFTKLMSSLPGVVLGRRDEGERFWIKVWTLRYNSYIEEVLK